MVQRPIQQELQDIQGQIKDIQMLLVHQKDHVGEAQLISQYEENLTKHIEACRQCAKKNWATFEDINTTYVHNAVLK